MYYPCSENKGADQLRGHREADLRLCFRICKKRFIHDKAHMSVTDYCDNVTTQTLLKTISQEHLRWCLKHMSYIPYSHKKTYNERTKEGIFDDN